MLFPCGGEQDDIIEIEEARFPVKTGEDAMHEAGEGGGSVAKAKGDLVKGTIFHRSGRIFHFSFFLFFFFLIGKDL